MATATQAPLMTAEEFGRRPDPGHPEELVRGVIITMPPPRARHGQVCGNAYFLIRSFAQNHDLGHVLCNDSGVITRRDPDTVRGADLAFYSFARLPRGPLRAEYPTVAPELVIEVRSPDDRWREIFTKVAEYLGVGVLQVVVLDPEAATAHLYGADQPPRTLTSDDFLEFPGILEGFRVSVSQFFE